MQGMSEQEVKALAYHHGYSIMFYHGTDKTDVVICDNTFLPATPLDERFADFKRRLAIAVESFKQRYGKDIGA